MDSRNCQKLVVLLIVGVSSVVTAQDRPVPSAHQTYHKPHHLLPGVSTIQPGFIHAPVINDPACCECQTCQPRLVESFARNMHSKLGVASGVMERAGLKSVRPVKLSFYGGAEAITWSTNAPSVAPLITTSRSGTAQSDAGVLGVSTTRTVFGGDLFDDSRLGGRYTGAIVIDGDSRWVLEAVYTMIGEDELFVRTDASDFDIVARPFYNAETSMEDARLVVYPGVADGRIDLSGETSFNTFQLALRRCLGEVLGASTDLTIGYRKAQLDDTLQVFDVTNSLSGATAGSRFEVRDSFRADNQFDGVDLGLVMRWCKTPKLTIDLLTKVALGNSESVVRIDGRTITRPSGGTRSGAPGGLLAQTTNIGRYRDSDFGAIFELGATMTYQFRSNVRGVVGYTLLNWNDISRVADQLDTAVNPTQFPPGPLVGDPRPRFRFDNSDFTAHGLRVGLQIEF